MHFVWNTIVEEIVGNGKVEGIVTRHIQSGVKEQVVTDGVFIFIGHYPNTDLFRGHLTMDDQGYLITYKHMLTSVPGVFAAGEVQDPIYRQIVSSAGQGCQAAMSAERWLQARE